MSREGSVEGPHDSKWFAATHWDTLSAARSEQGRDQQKAMRELTRTYWQPLYQYIRRHGYSEVDSKRLIQDFFGHLFHSKKHSKLDRRGKLRTFLLHLLQQYLDRPHPGNARDIIGTMQFISEKEFEEEERMELKLAEPFYPEQVFERRWAINLSDQAVRLLRDEYYATGKAELYEALKDFEPGRAGFELEDLEERLGMSAPAIHSAARRMHRRYVQILRELISATVSAAEELEEELRHLIAALGTLHIEE